MKIQLDILGSRKFFLGALVALLAGFILPVQSAVLVLYTGEGDTTSATDQLDADGSQNGTFINSTVVNTDSKFGTNAYGFDGDNPYDKIAFGIANQSLGTAFTLAAFVKQVDATNTRIFSSYPGGGGTGSSLIFDFENNYNAGSLGANEIRFLLNGLVVYGNVAADPGYANSYYHYAVTYNNGAVNIYFNGTNVGSGTIGSGAFTLSGDLFFGEDQAGTNNENINGSADDILIYNQALGASDIAYIAEYGARSWLIPEPSSMSLIVVSASLLYLRRRLKG